MSIRLMLAPGRKRTGRGGTGSLVGAAFHPDRRQAPRVGVDRDGIGLDRHAICEANAATRVTAHDLLACGTGPRLNKSPGISVIRGCQRFFVRLRSGATPCSLKCRHRLSLQRCKG